MVYKSMLVGILACAACAIGGYYAAAEKYSGEYHAHVRENTDNLRDNLNNNTRNRIQSNKLNMHELQALQEGAPDAVQKMLRIRIRVNVETFHDILNSPDIKKVLTEDTQKKLEEHIAEAQKALSH